jgi:glycosyltransferase involved in cell wall biosynthesis
MRVIIIHHLLWAHYKNAFYEELIKQSERYSGLDIHILQIAKNEYTRAEMPIQFMPNYQYKLLFDGMLEDVPKLMIFKSILKEINDFKPEIVNINGFFTWYHILTAFYCKLKGIKIILSNDSTANDNPKVWWKSLLKRAMIRISDGYYCFGTKSAEYLSTFGADDTKFLSKKGAVVNNDFISESFQKALPNRGLNLEELGIKTAKNFIFVGRFIDFKNLPLLISAFKEAQSKANNQWGLVFLGDGFLREILQKQIKNEAVQNTHFLGGKSWFEVPDYLALADVLVLPSKSEPWGLVVNEAMICGLPVVVSDRCGSAVDLVIEGKTGFSFPFDDEKNLAAILIKIMNEEIDLKQMGINAQEKIKEFSPQIAAEELIKGFFSLKPA